MDIKFACIVGGVENIYPGKTAVMVVLGGSELKTEFGFFGPLAIPAEDCSEMAVESMVAHLNSQKANNDAVVITGSEPLQQMEAVFSVCQQLKEKGFAVKIETTGFYADHLEKILPLVDYVAMDLKTEFDADKLAALTGFRGEPATLMQDTLRSIGILKNYKEKKPEFQVEFRTTIIPKVNDTEEIIEKMAKEIPFADVYALQQFIAESKLADPELRKLGTTSKPLMIQLAVIAKKYVKKVVVRTKDEGEQEVE
ncbi:MAG: 4Fe-4S cluster-binding domain-containing protein [Candidatus Micrarchaeota archaeon]